jgi:hypothetical protein
LRSITKIDTQQFLPHRHSLGRAQRFIFANDIADTAGNKEGRRMAPSLRFSETLFYHT